MLQSNKKRIRILINNRGESIRDFIYVDDLVRGLYKCLIYADHRDVINLGSGVETSILKLINKLEKILGKQFNIKISPSRHKQKIVKRSQANIGKAKTILNWEPRNTLLEGLISTINQNHNSPIK